MGPKIPAFTPEPRGRHSSHGPDEPEDAPPENDGKLPPATRPSCSQVRNSRRCLASDMMRLQMHGTRDSYPDKAVDGRSPVGSSSVPIRALGT
jgi:hypothetical protein